MNRKYDKKRIGLVLSSAPGYSETFFRNKIAGLQNQGHDVTMFVDYAPQQSEKFSYKVVSNVQFKKGFFKTVSELFKVVRKTIFKHPTASYRLFLLDRADGLSILSCLRNLILNEFLLNENVDWLHFGFGMLANGRENVATAISAETAVSFRGFDLYLSPLKHPGCYDLLFDKNVKYHVLSKAMRLILMNKGVSEQKISVITPAIDISLFDNGNLNLEPSSKPLKLITIARLHWVKGLEYTLEALAILKKRNIIFKYNIIGSGQEKERLLFAAEQLGISNCVNFLGRKTQTEIKTYLKEADVYLQYSIQEGFCNAVLEAQAMGILCIVSNADGLIENVLDNKTGWVAPKRNPLQLADRIQYVMGLSDEEKHKIQKTAIRRVKLEFNMEKQKREFHQFYQY